MSFNMYELEQNIALIIPAYEPDERFPELIKNIRESFNGHIIVVNDGSAPEYDHFYDEVCKYNCELIKHFVNLGKGRALKDAFNYCLNNYPELKGCVTADSDGQHIPEDIFKCMDELLHNPECLILGCRDFSGPDVPSKSKVGNKLSRGLCRYLCGVKVSDTQTGLRGIPSGYMAELMAVKGERFEFETIMLFEQRDRYPIKEIIINTVYDSKENHQTHYDPVKDTIKIGRIFAGVFVKFVFASLSSTIIDLLLFTLFCTIFEPVSSLWYVTIATVLARILSSIYNYIINYSVVFKSNEKQNRTIVRYFLLMIVQMSCSALLVTLGTLALPFIHETVIKVVVDTCLFFISYFIQIRFIF